MGEFEEALKSIRERFSGEDLGELDVLEKYKGSELRKKAELSEQRERENEALKAEVKRLKTAPKITEALEKAGVDFEALRPTEVQAIDALTFEGDEPSDEWVAKIVSEGGFPMKEGAGEQGSGETEPAAAKIARQAKGAPTGGGTLQSTITPETVANWPQEKRLRFRKEHKDAWNKLRDGEVVTGIAFA